MLRRPGDDEDLWEIPKKGYDWWSWKKPRPTG